MADTAQQTQQISNLISQGVGAILVDAASGTGLNGIIQQACARGIVVVAYDNLVTAPCAIKINGSQYSYGQQNAPDVPHTLWQHADDEAWPGIGNCDCSVFNGDLDGLLARIHA